MSIAIWSILVLIFSIVCHEIGHGYAALRFGDSTAKDAGRLTLNPIPHIDPFGSVLLPALCIFLGMPIFGWAKPVPVCTAYLSPYRLGMFCVAIAGITVNLCLALSAAIFIRIFPVTHLIPILVHVVVINIALALFNLIPVPPLDGSRIFEPFLPASIVSWMNQHQMILLLLLIFGLPHLPFTQLIMSISYWLLHA